MWESGTILVDFTNGDSNGMHHVFAHSSRILVEFTE